MLLTSNSVLSGMSDAEITRAIDSVLVRLVWRSRYRRVLIASVVVGQGKLSAVNIPDLSVKLLAALDLNGNGSVEKIEFAAKYDTVGIHATAACLEVAHLMCVV